MNDTRVTLPCYQVKVAGHVVTNTNRRESAHECFRGASAKPAEIWLINQNGSAVLLERSV